MIVPKSACAVGITFLSLLMIYSTYANASQALALVPKGTKGMGIEDHSLIQRGLQTFSATEIAKFTGVDSEELGCRPSYSSDGRRYSVGTAPQHATWRGRTGYHFCVVFEKDAGVWTEIKRFDSSVGVCKMSKDGKTVVTFNKVYTEDPTTGWNSVNVDGLATYYQTIYHSGHQKEPVAITPDGSRFVVGRRDELVDNKPSLAVFHYNSTSSQYELNKILQGWNVVIMSAHLSADGNRLVAYAYGGSGAALIWDFDGASWSHTHTISDAFYNKDMSADGNRLLSCTNDATVWDYDETTLTWTKVATIPYGTSDMYACILSPSGNRAVIGALPNVKVFDLEDGSSSNWVERGSISFSGGITYGSRTDAAFSDYNGISLAISAGHYQAGNERLEGINYFYTLSDQLKIGEEPKGANTLQLPAKFDLPLPNCTTNESAIGIVTCAFTGIVCPGNATQSMSILSYDCEADYNATIFGNTSVTENSTSSTCDPDVSEFNAVAKVDYTSGHSGDVSFCIRTDLTESNEIMYYRSQRINMTFSYDGGFSVTSFNTTEYEGMRKEATVATKSFGVIAEICDSGGNALTGPSALAIGDNLFVCIKTKDEGTKITAITEFTAEKDTGTVTEQKLEIDESMSNVVVTGLGSEKLMVVINFPARFFTNNNIIILKGDVEVDGTKNRRLLHSRALQEATPDVSSKDATFGLVIEVVADTSSATGHGMMVAALLGVPVLLLV